MMDSAQPITSQTEHTSQGRVGVIFSRTLLESVIGILLWGGGLSFITFIAAIIYPILQANNVILNLLAGFGILDRFADNYGVDANVLVSFRGFLAFQILDWIPLLLAMYMIPKTLGIILEEEKRGMLDILLSTPIPRWRFFSEKLLALYVSLALIIVMVWGALLACRLIFPHVQLTPIEITTAVWHLFPISAAIASIGLFSTVIFRNLRNAAGAAGGFILFSYFIRSVADTTRAETLLELKKLSIFNYFSTITMFSYGWQPRWDFILLGVALLLSFLSLFLFLKRDIRP